MALFNTVGGGGGIGVPSLDIDHRQFDITPEDKYQGQQTMIQSTLTNKYTINHVLVKSKSPK